MNEPKVSIIIPVYNTAEYVRQAVESITEQTLREIEIIVVNDGSTDGSLQILQELAGKDSRIQVYSQENKGLSVTRNIGLNHARGKYVYFMDSDDLLETDALELCYNKCVNDKLDFVFFDATSFSGDGDDLNNRFDYRRTEGLVEQIYLGTDILKIQLQRYEFKSSVCLNIIYREFLITHQITFYPNILHEDQLFTTLIYLQSKRVGFIHRAFFKRRVRRDSIMTRKFAWRNMQGYLTVSDELLTYAKANQEIRPVIDLFLKQMLDAAVWQAHVLPFRQRIRLFCKSASKYKQYVSKRTLSTLLFKSLALK
ncbi:glycosyltransferase [Bacteroides ihuae]|uniref:glycosyltransferase n=1 Tax=Bacteroides ihuae TaxID=1852362 RepID=UPI0008DB2376|nr:glycosyltransferase [Bacteroides ihuae]